MPSQKMTPDRITAILVLLPSVLLIGLFVYGLIGQTVYYSLTDWKGLDADKAINVVGLENYADLFTDPANITALRFRGGIVNTVFLTVLFLVFCLGIGLALAILIDQKIKGEAIFRTIFLFPMALSFVVTGTVWRWLFAPQNGLNALPAALGGKALSPTDFPWFTDRRTVAQFSWGNAAQVVAIVILLAVGVFALRAFLNRRMGIAVFLTLIGLAFGGAFFLGDSPLSQAFLRVQRPFYGFNLALIAIVIATVWQMSGYTMAMYLAGLRGIPEELREAARVDGCDEFGVYRKIVLPLLAPITLSAMIILGHISLKLFDLIYVMAGGDNNFVDVPGIWMYLTAFRGNNFAVAGAIAVVMLVLVAIVIVPYLISSFRSEAKR
jgi:glucose/mannose transport system permease protein